MAAKSIPGIKKFNPDKKLSNNPQGLKQTNSDKPKVKVAPMPTLSTQQKQDKALSDLMKKRAKESKKTGLWPNYGTN